MGLFFGIMEAAIPNQEVFRHPYQDEDMKTSFLQALKNSESFTFCFAIILLILRSQPY